MINGKQYVGSAVDLSNRFSQYYSTAYMEDALTRSISHIYRALLKNGHSNFSLTILEYCEPEECLEREDYYLSSEKHKYNIAKKAGASMFGRKHSDVTKTIMSDARKGEKNPNYGQKVEGSG
jgi:group I intron endonuclease